MCSLLFSTKIPRDIDNANKYLLPRGPDKTVHKEIEGMFFLHNILSITGDFTPQPIIDGDIVLLYNGELYNQPNYPCDTLSIIPLYKKYGTDFVKHLDGEFAIVLVDFHKGLIIATSDVFGTKPLFYSLEGGLGIATYKSALVECGFTNIRKMSANTTFIFCLAPNPILVASLPVHTFDLEQYKTNYDDWLAAFSQSIQKRCGRNREKLFIGLSSGYDSAVIACELKNQNIPFKCYSVIGSENKGILEKRWKLLEGHCELDIITITPEFRAQAHQYLLDNTEDWKYTIKSTRSDYNEHHLSLWDDNGSNALSYVCSLAKRDNRKIFISGAGADELYSDYGFGTSKYAHSNFLGIYPKNLTEDFIKNTWLSFYGSSMESYLAKDEWVSGAYSLEGRYPFIDVALVQEFLNLSVDLKNSKYKSVLHEYLTRNNFPFSPGEKIGF